MTRKERRERKKRKNLINYLIICTTLSFMFILGIEEYKDSKIKEKKINNISYTTQKMSINSTNDEQKKEKVKNYPKEEIPKEYRGYRIAAKLEIPQIDLETYILSTYSEKSLNISVTKFWGADPNKQGNCCVAGHNAQNKNMFHNLRNLKTGEKLWVIDNEIGKVEYEIYDIYTVQPEDINCLSQDTEGRREITLITCTNDSKKRVIVKAKEKD